ncbi:MAG TPA: YhcH/YjgK/YiaL family protein [Sphaerochaeta sp.]|jgi:YhcH/YjgK/YiaL family protein|nr:DUF386 domain-containing protein [Spirochaetales bacterium]HPX29162.1 YhcH/YjgK/YiaL family protein [Sphaerochaeta sp.]HQB54079.1 YhcH/YjgK/YiaL family protein [Sphaerochaeta sp.]
MIIDSLSNLSRYISAVPELRLIQQILAGDLLSKELGSYETSDPNLRYIIMTYQTEKKETDLYEIHKKETDVQILLQGTEVMEIGSRESFKTTVAYDAAKDAAFGPAESILTYRADQNHFALFFPGEPHAPNLIDKVQQRIIKVVFKIRRA